MVLESTRPKPPRAGRISSDRSGLEALIGKSRFGIQAEGGNWTGDWKAEAGASAADSWMNVGGYQVAGDGAGPWAHQVGSPT